MSINNNQLENLEKIIIPHFNSLLKEIPQYGEVIFNFKVFDYKPGSIHKGCIECELINKNKQGEGL